MNELKLLLSNEEHIVYQYTPESKGEPGKITVNRITGDVFLSVRAEQDGSGRYGQYAVKRVKEYVAKKNLPIDAVQAWY